MATIDIFASFEFDKDQDLRGNFYRQAKNLSPHRIRNCSLREAYPTDEWKGQGKGGNRAMRFGHHPDWAGYSQRARR